MPKIGVHLRDSSSIEALSAGIRHLHMPYVQFFVRALHGKLLTADRESCRMFHTACEETGVVPYLHLSYRVNAADTHFTRHPLLEQEIRLARYLGIQHIVIHAGAARDRESGIEATARLLNQVTRNHPAVWLLENSPFDKPSIGGDLYDLRAIYEKIDRPDRVGYCIDTAHAHAYGYQLATSDAALENFIQDLDTILGFEHIKLTHLNDAQSACGSRHDVHAMLGDGFIGLERLVQYVSHSYTANIPAIVELPVLADVLWQEQCKLITTINIDVRTNLLV